MKISPHLLCRFGLGVCWIAVADTNGFLLSEDLRKHINSMWVLTTERPTRSWAESACDVRVPDAGLGQTTISRHK